MKSLVAIIAATVAASSIILAPVAIAGPVSGGIALSPMSQQQAVRKAQDYLDYTAFSRTGLINQLSSFEGFSVSDATFAVDSLDVDWNEQAAKKAADYLDYTSFSHSSLMNQLISFEGFTPQQAAYGTSAVGL